MDKIKAALEALGVPKIYWRSLALALTLGIAVGMLSASSAFTDPDTSWVWVPFAAATAFLGGGLLVAVLTFLILAAFVYGWQQEASAVVEDNQDVMVDEEYDG